MYPSLSITSFIHWLSFLHCFLIFFYENSHRLSLAKFPQELAASYIGIRIGEKDVIIGISFPRYSMRTLKALEFASNRKAKVITLTDSIHSPMNLYSSCNLIARSDMASIVDSLVAPLSVVNALIVALCMKKQKEVVSTLETLEEIWGEYQVYSSDELNHVSDTVTVEGEKSHE